MSRVRIGELVELTARVERVGRVVDDRRRERNRRAACHGPPADRHAWLIRNDRSRRSRQADAASKSYGDNGAVKPHAVRTHKSSEHLAREDQLAWKIAEVAADPVAVEPT